MGKKVAKKTSTQTPKMRTPKHGRGKLQVGNPGNSGGGRPLDEFKAKMRELASSDKAIEYLEECVRGKHGPKAAVSAHKHITERGYGKEPSPVELGGKLRVEVAVVNEVSS